jgi:hypothetical protein
MKEANDLVPDDEPILRAVHEFLRSGGPRVVVPARERSHQLFGDEKALTRLRSGRLFLEGRLSPQLLAFEDVPPVLPLVIVGSGPDVLIVENLATWHSFSRCGPFPDTIRAVGFGQGGGFVQSIARLVETRPRRVIYFGDVDARGLSIPQLAADVAISRALPRPEPAGRLYELLLEVGTRARHVAVPEAVAAELTSWLPESTSARAASILRGGDRIAQEAVGTELLTRRGGWADLVD